jgi:hypothetical protein
MATEGRHSPFAARAKAKRGTMKSLGTFTFRDFRFEVFRAEMWPFKVEDEVLLEGHEESRTGWGFDIAAGPPFEKPKGSKGEIFCDGICLDAEDEPVPLPRVKDLSGVDFSLRRPYNPQSEEDYFTFSCPAYKQVSRIRIRFLERKGRRYRIRLSVLVHHVFARPTELTYEGWIHVVKERGTSPVPEEKPDFGKGPRTIQGVCTGVNVSRKVMELIKPLRTGGYSGGYPIHFTSRTRFLGPSGEELKGQGIKNLHYKEVTVKVAVVDRRQVAVEVTELPEE